MGVVLERIHLRHVVRLAASLLGVLAVLASFSTTAQARNYVVFVQDDADVATVASSVGVTPAHQYQYVARGFVADLSTYQADRLANDDRVVDVRSDQTFALMPFKRAPFKRAPFKRAPFKRAPFKRAPFKRADLTSPYHVQVAPTGVQRVGAFGMGLAQVDADIAILDGGIDVNHPDLNVAGAVSCVPGEGVADRDGHGTMVAGLAAARDNGFGVVGVAPGARIWSVKVADANGIVMESAALCGMEWVLAHADSVDVANMSWAGETSSIATDCSGDELARPERARRWRSMSPAMRGRYPWRPASRTHRRWGWHHHAESSSVDPAAVDALGALMCATRDAGVTLVAAAGNDAQDASHFLPAAWPAVMAVSSLSDTDGRPGGFGRRGCMTHDRDDVMSSFSNFGASIAIAAPGECLVSTDTHGGYAVGSGTSFAAPLVAGAAVLLTANTPGITPDQVQAHLRATAEPGRIRGDRDRYNEGVLHVLI